MKIKKYGVIPFLLIAAMPFLLAAKGKGKGGSDTPGQEDPGTILGAPGQLTEYRFTNWINLDKKLTVAGPVTIVLEQGMNFNNGASIHVEPEGELTIYAKNGFQPNSNPITVEGGGKATFVVNGDFTANVMNIARTGNVVVYGKSNMQFGSSVNVDGRPASLMVYGTKTSSQQDITFGGNSGFSGVIYAPYAHIMNNGSGSLYGSIVAKAITFNGAPEGFWFDESLLVLSLPQEGDEEESTNATFAVEEIERYYIPRAPATEEIQSMAGVEMTYDAFFASVFQ